MLERYEMIIHSYKNYFPNFYSQTVECRPSGRHCILVTLNDGSKMEFNSFDNSIRDVSKYYDRRSVDETSWRKEFGRKLYRAIVDKGITQEALADTLGISRQMLSRYVTGNSTPSSYNLARLSEILDCDVRELTRFGYIDEE